MEFIIDEDLLAKKRVTPLLDEGEELKRIFVLPGTRPKAERIINQ